MKKKVLLIMGLCLLLMAGGCGKTGAAGDLKSNPSTDKSDTTGKSVKPEYTATKYVTLGAYKGIEVTITKKTVTDKQVDDAIKQQLESAPAYEEIKDKKVVKKGDIVNIDYEGLKDGVAFEGGTSKGYHLTIGAGQFIPGFEDGLIDKKVGEKVKLNITFPTTYQSKDLAGKAVVFNVTINKIEKEVKAVLTEAYVKENTQFASIDELKKAVRQQLESQNDSAKQTELQTNLINKIVENAKFSEVPKDLQKYYEDYMNYQIEQSAAQSGTDVKTYLSQMDMDTDSFKKYVTDYAQSQAKQEMALKAIAETEKLEVTDKELKDKIAELMKTYSKTEKELYAAMSKEEIKSSMLLQKAYGLIMDKCVLKTVTPAPTPSGTPKPAK